MKLHLEHLSWDSGFFGYKIGRIVLGPEADLQDLQALADTAAAEGYKLVYLFTNEVLPETFAVPHVKNLLLADRKVTYFQQLDNFTAEAYTVNIARYTNLTLDEKLLEIALQSGSYSRFAVDPNFKNKEFEKLYTEWILKSVSGELAKEVWVSLNELNQITGLITLGIKNKIPDIGLLAVDSQSRGSNIGKQLIQLAKARALDWGSNSLQVVTQLDNAGACRFYERCGFRQEKIEHIYHIWL